MAIAFYFAERARIDHARPLKLKTIWREQRRIVFFFQAMTRPFAREIVDLIDNPQPRRAHRSYPAALYYAARIRLALPL